MTNFSNRWIIDECIGNPWDNKMHHMVDYSIVFFKENFFSNVDIKLKITFRKNVITYILK